MSGGVYLGRVCGIRLYLDYSWFLIVAIVTYELAFVIFPYYLPQRSTALYLGMAICGAIIFFASILLHELGHGVVSQRCGIPVPRITLLLIGGIAEISREPDNARAELKIAAGGPVVSILLSLLYGAGAFIARLLHWDAPEVVLAWLAWVNIALALFNAIPGYPLDGGRMLRAIIWQRTGDIRKATFISTRIGIGFSWLLIALGVVELFEGAWNAFVPILIGVFLKGAAENGYTSTVQHQILTGIRVSDIMSKAPVCIPARAPINLVVEEYFLARQHVAYPVTGDDGDFRGLLRLEFLKEVPREKWPYTTAGDVAGAYGTTGALIESTEPAESAMRRLLAAEEGRLAVVESGRVTGFITRHDVLRFITIHKELESAAQSR
jgi:Zn-dependent protease